ncbi:HAD superfamily hydrolase (TIGR01509 family)/HAD superfamily hydrolase (TIGR01549 family) [Streptomyces sp. 846.5]|nr:HAD-IA family hydrolase [Streptomyces sp. 846.5]TDU04554.1 HAD superfamily hydrolase (TIGR01509 family)/HAD superfamily hydrolase (TIGR01549 family) [Streptomyces sp. 846.5]
MNQGFSHRNIPLRIEADIAGELSVPDGSRLKLRIPDRSGIPFDPIVWDDEDRTLQLLANRFQGKQRLPRVVVRLDQGSVHTFSEGSVLSEEWPSLSNLSDGRISQLADFFAALALVRRSDGGALARLPSGWPADGNSSGFLRWQIRYTAECVEPLAWKQYGAVLEALNFPEDALERFAKLVPQLKPRPFSLLHGDLHPGNIIVGADGSLDVIDWELAMMGDPLHDLAIHLERSRYPNLGEEDRFIEAWRTSVAAVAPAAVNGLERDLRWYRLFQAVRSVYTDVVRTVERLRQEPWTVTVDQAAADLVRIVNRARCVLEPGTRVGHVAARGAAVATVARDLPSPVRAVLLDFDGPVCDLFAGHNADKIAMLICERLEAEELLPADFSERGGEAWQDPHALLRVVGDLLEADRRPAEAVAQARKMVHVLLGKAEVDAVPTARQTSHAIELIRELPRRGIAVAIVSNNAKAAVVDYLRRAAGRGPELVPEGLIFGRPDKPALMKPNRHMLDKAMAELGMTPGQCVFLGDSEADVKAAEAAGMTFFGYHGGVHHRRERMQEWQVPEERQLGSLECLVVGVTPRT